MSWENYKGLEIPSARTGDAGINLKEDLMLLADRSLSESAVPGSVVFVGGAMGSPVLQEDVPTLRVKFENGIIKTLASGS